MISREIEMLKNKVGSIESFIPLMNFLSLRIERLTQQFPSPIVFFVSVLQEGILKATNDILQERVL